MKTREELEREIDEIREAAKADMAMWLLHKDKEEEGSWLGLFIALGICIAIVSAFILLRQH